MHDHNSESKTIVACLEFLSRDALDKELYLVHDIIRSSIIEIEKIDKGGVNQTINIEYSDIFNAFKFFAKFCLAEESTQKQIMELINGIDQGALLGCTTYN